MLNLPVKRVNSLTLASTERIHALLANFFKLKQPVVCAGQNISAWFVKKILPGFFSLWSGSFVFTASLLPTRLTNYCFISFYILSHYYSCIFFLFSCFLGVPNFFLAFSRFSLPLSFSNFRGSYSSNYMYNNEWLQWVQCSKILIIRPSRLS